MSWEELHRCRYHPDCSIHIGEGRLTEDLSGRERDEIISAYRDGVPPSEIARWHGINRGQVWRIRNQV